MPHSAITQSRLRRAFRYVYFAFLAVVATLLALLGLWIINGDLAAMLAGTLRESSGLMMSALALGLSVPLFFALWSLVGTALLGHDKGAPSLMDGIRD